jgi:hypothetical protein
MEDSMMVCHRRQKRKKVGVWGRMLGMSSRRVGTLDGMLRMSSRRVGTFRHQQGGIMLGMSSRRVGTLGGMLDTSSWRVSMLDGMLVCEQSTGWHVGWHAELVVCWAGSSV